MDGLENSRGRWSVIIPTIWKSGFIHKQLSDLIASTYVDDIILIDNSKEYYSYYPTKDPKVNLITPEENLFAYPSWNLGVKEAKNTNIILASDDIIWDPLLINHLDSTQFTNFDVIGQHPKNHISPIDYKTKNILKFSYREETVRPLGWGVLLFTQKDKWIPYPPELKMWYGDDWIVYVSSMRAGTVENFHFSGGMGGSFSTEIEPVILNDKEHYEKYFN